jgi:hypothetical protein
MNPDTGELDDIAVPRRKTFMRNKPCLCGSGKKFKACCWSKYSTNTKTRYVTRTQANLMRNKTE